VAVGMALVEREAVVLVESPHAGRAGKGLRRAHVALARAGIAVRETIAVGELERLRSWLRPPAGACPLIVAAGGDGTVGAVADALARLDRYDLRCLEQPLGWDDLLEHAELQRRLRTPVCLDESLRSPADVGRALDLGACRNVNLKPGRVGGVSAALQVHEMCLTRGVPLWCGGMLESGIGRAVNLALCSLPGFTEPADMSPASVLYAWDLVDPTYTVDPDGHVAVPDARIDF